MAGNPETKNTHVGLQIFPNRKGSLRDAAKSVPIPLYEAFSDERLIRTQRLSPQERKELANTPEATIALSAFILDTVSSFENCNIWEKFLLLTSYHFIIDDGFTRTKKIFQLSDTAFSSIRDYVENPDNQAKIKMLHKYTTLGKQLLLYGKEVNYIELYQWLLEQANDPQQDIKTWSTFAQEMPENLLNEKEKNAKGQERLVLVEKRLRTIADNLNELGLLSPDRLQRRDLRRAALQRKTAEALATIQATGVKAHIADLVPEEGLSHRRTQEILRGVRNTRNELFHGMSEETKQLLKEVSDILDVASPDDPHTRSHVTFHEIIDALSEKGIFATIPQLRKLYKSYGPIFGVNPKRENLTKETIDEIRYMAQLNIPLVDIALALGISRQSIWRVLSDRQEE